MYTVNTEAESLTSGVPKTILAIVGPNNRRHKVNRFTFGGNSIAATDPPVLVEFVRFDQTTAGTSTATTPQKENQAESASLCSGARTYTVEPTVGTVVDSLRISPIGNTIIWEIPKGKEYEQNVSTTFGVRCTSGSNLTNVTSSLGFDE
jgi:hypothetical protein